MTTQTMRAMSIAAVGGPEVLTEVELPVPEPDASQVLVRVHAAGVNPTDWKHRAGVISFREPPVVLGWDVSGVVERVGLGVTLFQPGDEVFGMLPYPHGAGAYAEYVVGPTRAFVRKPSEVDHEQAGAIPLAALTAYQALVDTAGVREGQRVLIHGAAGGVGHLAVQIAKARGAHVIGTASAGRHDFLRGIGVDEPIDYHAVDFADVVGDLDVVLDAVGMYGARSLPVLRRGGTFVTILPGRSGDLAAEAERLGVRVAMMLVEYDHAGMAAIADLVASGQLRATIAGSFPLAEVAKAHELGETNRTAGKLVLTVR